MTSIKRFLILVLCLITKKTDQFFVRRSEKMDELGVTREACDSIANSVWQLGSGATSCQCFSPKTFHFDGQRLACMARIDGCEVAFMKSTEKSYFFEGGLIESDDCEMKTTEISNNDGSWSREDAEMDFKEKDRYTQIEFDDEDSEYDGKLVKATLSTECYIPCVVLKLQGFDVYNDNTINIKPTTTTTLTPTTPTPPLITTKTTTTTTEATFPPSTATYPPSTTTDSPPKTLPPITTTTTEATFPPSPATYPPWTTTDSPPKTLQPITTTTTKATFPPSPATYPPWTTTDSPPKTLPPITTTTTTEATFPPSPTTYPPWTTTDSPPKTLPPTTTTTPTIQIVIPLGGFIAIGIVLLLVVVICLFFNRSRCFGSKESSKERPDPYFIRRPAENLYHVENNYTDISETRFAAPAAQDAYKKQPPEYAQVDELMKNKPSN